MVAPVLNRSLKTNKIYKCFNSKTWLGSRYYREYGNHNSQFTDLSKTKKLLRFILIKTTKFAYRFVTLRYKELQWKEII
jgi:patatin-like phospholipase/acyl hydrolase